MTRKQYLMSLKWNDFSHYPPQGIDIYIHGVGHDPKDKSELHHFMRIAQFNAITFDSKVISNIFKPNIVWDFYWLPATSIKENL